MRQNRGFLLREIAGIPYLLPYGQMIAEHKRGIKINSTGVYLWNLLEQEHSLEELLSMSAAYYEIPAKQLKEFHSDITHFINELLAYGILINSPTVSTDHYEAKLLSIGNLGIKFVGPDTAFPSEFTDFTVSMLPQIHQTIKLHIGSAPLYEGGQILLRNKELMIIEHETQYLLLFPESKQLSEIHLTKDGSLATCYCFPPYTESFHYDLFHALRLAFLYLAQTKGMITIHSASFLYKGHAWIFSGRSGMGKSTHTNLWKELYGTPIINGDLNLLALEDGIPMVHGIPWCGTSGLYSTQSYPLGGIVLLKRAAYDTTEELSTDTKQLLISQRLISPTWTPMQFDSNLSLVAELTDKILVCKLNCTKENHAAEVMKNRIDSYLEEKKSDVL